MLHPTDGGRLVKLMRPTPVRVVQRLEWPHSGNPSFVVVRCNG